MFLGSKHDLSTSWPGEEQQNTVGCSTTGLRSRIFRCKCNRHKIETGSIL